MTIIGVHARVEDKRHVVGFAVLDGDVVIATSSLTAPSSDHGRSLSELYREAHDLIGAHEPDALAVLRSEAFRQPKSFGLSRQADGAVLAAAGHRDCPVIEWKSVSSLREPLGLSGKARNPETMAAAIAMLAGGLDEAPGEVAYAAAAALAAGRKLSA